MRLRIVEAAQEQIDVSTSFELNRYVGGYTTCRAVGPSGVSFTFRASVPVTIGQFVDVLDEGGFQLVPFGEPS